MAKSRRSIDYKKATITKNEDGEFIITEYIKDGITNVYNLSNELESWIDEDEISLNIKKDIEVLSEMNDEEENNYEDEEENDY